MVSNSVIYLFLAWTIINAAIVAYMSIQSFKMFKTCPCAILSKDKRTGVVSLVNQYLPLNLWWTTLTIFSIVSITTAYYLVMGIINGTRKINFWTVAIVLVITSFAFVYVTSLYFQSLKENKCDCLKNKYIAYLDRVQNIRKTIALIVIVFLLFAAFYFAFFSH